MRRSVQGVALIAVLWIVLLLTVMATAIATRSVEGRWAAARGGQSASLDTSADSAIRLTLAALIANVRVPDRPIPVLTTRMIGDDQIELTVEQESGRIDVNTVEEPLLLAYLRAAEWDSTSAQQFVNRLRDWQDTDDVEREGGLERDGYAARGAKGLPRNGPMASIEELRHIPGAEKLSPELLEGLTVYSHLSVPSGLSPRVVQHALAFAEEHQLGGRTWLSNSQSSESERIIAGNVVRIRACAHRKALRRCRAVVVRLTGGVTEPIQIFVWQSDADST
jgi:general secretion pathway protein K